MLKKNDTYLGNFKQVKQDLITVVNTYLTTYFEDLFDDTTQGWKRYQTSLSRFFSFHGQEGYRLALRTLEKFHRAQNVEELLSCALHQTGGQTMHRNIIDHLLTHAISYDADDIEKEVGAVQLRAMESSSGAACFMPGTARRFALENLLCRVLGARGESCAATLKMNYF